MAEWTEEVTQVAGSNLAIIKGGTGKPLLVLHEELGHPGWLTWHAALARAHTLLIPIQPGLGKSALVRAALAAAAAAGCRVCWGAGDELGHALPLLPLLDALRVREPSPTPRPNTLARLRHRYALHFYWPAGAGQPQERLVTAALSRSAGAEYRNAEVRYRRAYIPIPSGRSGGYGRSGGRSGHGGGRGGYGGGHGRGYGGGYGHGHGGGYGRGYGGGYGCGYGYGYGRGYGYRGYYGPGYGWGYGGYGYRFGYYPFVYAPPPVYYAPPPVYYPPPAYYPPPVY